jgi:hypothetical protein
VPGLVLRQQVQAEKDEVQFGVQRQTTGILFWSRARLQVFYIGASAAESGRKLKNLPDTELAICGGFLRRVFAEERINL